MKRNIFVFIISSLLLFNSLLISQNQSAKDVIFLIDLSASMNRNHLFDKVKDAVNETLSEGIQAGDYVTILGFDSEVYIKAEKKIKNVGDVFRLKEIVNNLAARGQWTYITNALSITAQKLEGLMAEKPNSTKIVYLLTDGNNDPPRNISNPLTYDDLKNNYFNTFTAKNSFFYIFRFGIENVDEKQKEFVKDTGIKDIDVDDINNISMVTIIPQKINREITTTDISDIVDTLILEVGASKIKDPIDVEFSISQNMELLKSKVSIKKIGQIIKLPVKLSKVEGTEISGTLHLQYDRNELNIIIPGDIPIKYSITILEEAKTEVIDDENEGEGMMSVLIPLMIVVFILVLLFIICKFLLPKFPDNLELIVEDKETNRNNGNYSLAEHNSFCSTSISVGDNKDIDIDLDGTIIKLLPTKNGLKIKVVNGEVWDQFESEESLYSSGKSFDVYNDAEILTNSQKLKFNLEEDLEDDDFSEDE